MHPAAGPMASAFGIGIRGGECIRGPRAAIGARGGGAVRPKGAQSRTGDGGAHVLDGREHRLLRRLRARAGTRQLGW